MQSSIKVIFDLYNIFLDNIVTLSKDPMYLPISINILPTQLKGIFILYYIQGKIFFFASFVIIALGILYVGQLKYEKQCKVGMQYYSLFGKIWILIILQDLGIISCSFLFEIRVLKDFRVIRGLRKSDKGPLFKY